MYILYNIGMKIISTTKARQNISSIINQVKYHGDVFAIGRRDSIDAIIIKFPEAHNPDLNEITNMNAYSGSFDFLKDEPDIYTITDLKKRYV